MRNLIISKQSSSLVNRATSLMLASGLGLSGCFLSNGSSYELRTTSIPSYAVSGALFSSAPRFGVYKLASNDPFTLSGENIELTPYTDSTCTTAATGSFTVDSTSHALSTGIAEFASMSYSWPVASYEGQLYFKLRTSRFGLVLCSSRVGILRKFNSGTGYVAGGSTGVGGGSGATLDDFPRAIAIDSLGRILVGGRSMNTSSGDQAAFWRYLPDGTLDTTWTFGSTGAAGGTGTNTYDFPYSMVTDSSNNYYVFGRSADATSTSQNVGQNLAIWKYKTDGTLDTAFATAGRYTSTGLAGAGAGSQFDYALNGVRDSAGNLYATGLSNRGGAGNPNEWAAWKLSSTGALLNTYNNGATGFTNAGNNQRENIWGIAFDSQGRLVFAGSSRTAALGYRLAFARMDTSFNLDSTFGTSGITTGPATPAAGGTRDMLVGMVLDSQDRIIGTGYSINPSGGFQMAIWRYTANGTADTTFGTNGALTLSTSPAGATGAAQYDTGSKVFLAPDGSGYFVIGESDGSAGQSYVAVWKVTLNGALDTSFGSGTGYKLMSSTTTGFAGATGTSIREWAEAGVMDSFGRITITGPSADSAGKYRFSLWRFWTGTGLLDY